MEKMQGIVVFTLPLLFLALSALIESTDTEICQNFTLRLNETFPPDFNFHDKDKFLRKNVVNLVKCIRCALEKDKDRKPIFKKPENVTLNKSHLGSPDGRPRFIFHYIGSRGYKESCLGDAYKRDMIHRLYDAAATTYEEKIKFLDAMSCNSSQHLECRPIGNEEERKFAEQATPIMQCLCPNFNKTQTYLDDYTRGYYDHKRKVCVLKVGQVCKVTPNLMDRRLVWNDFDYEISPDEIIVPATSMNETIKPTPSSRSSDEPYKPPYTVGDGIQIVDLQPMPNPRACVNHAFCYTNDSKGLKISDMFRNKCVCRGGYYRGRDGECHRGTETPHPSALILATYTFIIGIIGFLGGLSHNF